MYALCKCRNGIPFDVITVYASRVAADKVCAVGQVVIPITCRDFTKILDGDLSPILNHG